MGGCEYAKRFTADFRAASLRPSHRLHWYTRDQITLTMNIDAKPLTHFVCSIFTAAGVRDVEAATEAEPVFVLFWKQRFVH